MSASLEGKRPPVPSSLPPPPSGSPHAAGAALPSRRRSMMSLALKLSSSVSWAS